MKHSSRRIDLNPIPNGAEIARLRILKGFSQDYVSKATKISERRLRDIERKDHPFPRHRLLEIATVLGVLVEQIIKEEVCVSAPSENSRADLAALFPLQGPAPAPENMLQLHVTHDALHYWETARGCDAYEWTLAVTPTMAVAPLIDELLAITKRTVEGLVMMDLHTNADEFDRQHEHPDVYRVARLSELVAELQAAGVTLLANTYYHNTRNAGPNDPWVVKRLRVMFAPPGAQKRLVEIDRGAKGVVWPSSEGKQTEDRDIPF